MLRVPVEPLLRRMSRMLVTGLLPSLLTLGPLRAEARVRNSSQEHQSPPQTAASTRARVFASDAGVVLNFIKPDRSANFEAILGRVREALHKSENPGRKQQAQSWKVFRAVEPAGNGNILY